MPHYDFEDMTTGERVELLLPMSEAPPWGGELGHEGRHLRRLVDFEGGEERTRVAPEPHFKCWQVAGEEAEGAAHYDADGCPVFTSRQEVSRFLARQRERGNHNAEYGDGWGKIRP